MSIAARIIGDANETALGAALDMAAEHRGAARLDRAHDAPFGAAEVAGMRLSIRLAVAAENMLRLERGHDRPASVRRRFRQLQPVERAGRVASWWLRPGYNAPWSTDADGRAAPGSCGYQCRLRADEWQSCGAAYGRSQAFRASPP